MHTLSKEDASPVAVSSGRASEFGAQLTGWVSALRPYQWSKNVLILLPLLLSHEFQRWRLVASFQALFAFSFCASAFYVLNDLLDREADRVHPRKAKRPFASGRLSLQQGVFLIGACLVPAIALAWMLPLSARMLLLLYALTNLGYSLVLKQIVFLDVLALAFLYTLRLLFGGAAEGIDVSLWTLAFFCLLFVGLAFVKRWTELLSSGERNGTCLARRGYHLSHLPLARRFAQWSMYLSVVVLALYIQSLAAEKLYRHPRFLWLVCLLLFLWVRRLILITSRGFMTDDPLVFAFRDTSSQVIALLIILCCALATG